MFKRYLSVILCSTAFVFANSEVNGDAIRALAHSGYAELDAAIAQQNAAEQNAIVEETEEAPELVETPIATADSTTVSTAVEDSVEKFEEQEASADSLENSQLADSEDKDTEPNGEDIPENGEEDSEEEQIAESDSSTVDSVSNELAAALDFSNGALPTVNPVRITSPYGIRHYRLHRGVDVKVYKGDSIVAAFPGTVITSQYERRGYGHYLKVKHENGTITVYGHLSKRLKKVGDTVEAGELIGLGGNTGRSTGSHLHFEIRYGQINIDPTTVFDFENGGLKKDVASYNVETASADHEAIQKELSKHRIYKVRRGDTLGSIARKYGTSVRRIKQLNGLRSDRIRAGQILRCS